MQSFLLSVKKSLGSEPQRLMPFIFLLLLHMYHPTNCEASIAGAAADTTRAITAESLSDTLTANEEGETSEPPPDNGSNPQTLSTEDVENTGLSDPEGRVEREPSAYTGTELRKGERLFKGLLAFQSGMHNCASCHAPSRTDTLNWNPSAYDLAQSWLNGENYSIKSKLDNPAGMRMMNDHQGMNITPEEERQLEAYLSQVARKGPGELQAIPIRAVLFWGFGLLMALALIDLLITKKVRFQALHILIIIAGLIVHMQYAVTESQALGRTPLYAPDQPIKFSHLVHASDNEIDCNYCHTISSFSLSAGIPSNNTCLNCHNVVREGSHSGRFEINKIHLAAQNGQAVRWIRVHKLPDHSFFSHAQHVKAAKLECQECHGLVEEMHILQQTEDLSMGWCLRCHRDNAVDFLDNAYFSIYSKLHEDMRAGLIDSVTAARIGGEDCMKCHY